MKITLQSPLPVTPPSEPEIGHLYRRKNPRGSTDIEETVYLAVQSSKGAVLIAISDGVYGYWSTDGFGTVGSEGWEDLGRALVQVDK